MTMLAHTRNMNRVRVGAEETPGYVLPTSVLAMVAIGGVFAYVLASVNEPMSQGEWNDRYGKKRVRR